MAAASGMMTNLAAIITRPQAERGGISALAGGRQSRRQERYVRQAPPSTVWACRRWHRFAGRHADVALSGTDRCPDMAIYARQNRRQTDSG